MSSKDRPASVLSVRKEDLEATNQAYNVNLKGDLNGRFVHRPVRSTSHVTEALPGSPAYASENQRLDNRDGIRAKAEVERLQKARGQILARHAKSRVDKARVELYAENAEVKHGMEALKLRQKAMAKQKIKYLKAVAVSSEQQRPRRLAQALTTRGMM